MVLHLMVFLLSLVLPGGPSDLGYSWPGVFIAGASGRAERFFTQLLFHYPISGSFCHAIVDFISSIFNFVPRAFPLKPLRPSRKKPSERGCSIFPFHRAINKRLPWSSIQVRQPLAFVENVPPFQYFHNWLHYE